MKEITINGREYTLEGNPKMKTVRYVEQMEIEMMRKYIDDEAILQMESSEDDAMGEVLEQADVDDLKEMMWERSTQQPLQTICLATDEKIDIEVIEDMKANDFLELKEASEDALGGTAEDFTEQLGIGIGSRVREIREQLESGETPSDENLPPSVSNLSSTQ